MDIKFSTVFGFVILRKHDWEKVQKLLAEKEREWYELVTLRGMQWEQEMYKPLYEKLKKDYEEAIKRIEELEKYKKLYADEVQKRLELIRLMEENKND